MRRLYCAQKTTSKTIEQVARLCLGASAESSIASGTGVSIPSSSVLAPAKKRRLLRATTVWKLLLAVMLLACLVGWKMRSFRHSKRRMRPCDETQEETECEVVSGAAARRCSSLLR